MNKRQILYLIVIVQVLFLLGMIACKQSTLLYGTAVLLKPVPVDPTDLIRGDYINILYEISTIQGSLFPADSDIRRGDKIYVQLQKKDTYWDIAAASTKKLTAPYLKGTVNDIYKRTTYTVRDENTGKEYFYEERTYEYTAPEERRLERGQRVQFNSFNENTIGYMEKCDGQQCPQIDDKSGAFLYGIITKIDQVDKEYSITYPIESYFIAKGTGNVPELLDVANMRVEVKLWRGDAIVTRLIYDGVPIEFQ